MGMKLFYFISLFFLISCAESTSTAERPFNSDETKYMAKSMTETLVKQRLKSPGTAEFSSDPRIVYIGDSSFVVTSWVDSQNSFGAMLRMNFTATVKFINVSGDMEQWRLIDFSEN